MMLGIIACIIIIIMVSASKDQPLISQIIESDVPAIYAYWQVRAMLVDPKSMENTIERRSGVIDEQYHRFYLSLRAFRANENYTTIWSDCTKSIHLDELESTDDIVDKLVKPEDKKRLKSILRTLEGDFECTLSDIRFMESIKRQNPNYHLSLIRFTVGILRRIQACKGMAPVAKGLEEQLLLKPENIKEDNRLESENDFPSSDDHSALIAMTVIGLASIIINIVQGVVTAKQSLAPAKSSPPLQSIST